jgi:GTP-binding protein
MNSHRQIGQLIFEGSFPKMPALDSLPEIAFVGRSNVGKSSAINTLLNHKKAARVSGRPGRTQLINCFRLDEKSRFVDLPGYGFAKVPLPVKEKWGRMIENYLLNREDLKLVVVLVDVRHTAQKMDIQMLNLLRHYHIPFLVLATKSDKMKKMALKKQVQKLQSGLSVHKNNMVIFSSLNKKGFAEAWNKIDIACGFDDGKKQS